MKKKEENYELLIIEKLGQLERGELENSPAGKKLAEEFEKIPEYKKIYENNKIK